MKKWITILIFVLPLSCTLWAQESGEPVNTHSWRFEANANLYFIPDDFFINPVLNADHEWLHLECRYNYEDMNTISFFGGYNFNVDKKVTLAITPVLGFSLGNTQGIIPGLEATLSYKNWELYTETEYLISSSVEDNFLYTWSDITYSPMDWLYVGISAQRTRLYQTDLDIQRGLLAGIGLKRLTISNYFYNIGGGDFFYLLSLGISI